MWCIFKELQRKIIYIPVEFIHLISFLEIEFLYSINKYKHMQILWFAKSVNLTLENICCLFTSAVRGGQNIIVYLAEQRNEVMALM